MIFAVAVDCLHLAALHLSTPRPEFFNACADASIRVLTLFASWRYWKHFWTFRLSLLEPWRSQCGPIERSYEGLLGQGVFQYLDFSEGLLVIPGESKALTRKVNELLLSLFTDATGLVVTPPCYAHSELGINDWLWFLKLCPALT